jgi:hypothetical protein
MTREARLLSGIILITVPTIQYGGYFLLTSLVNSFHATLCCRSTAGYLGSHG